jgi:hypothetical protein
MLLKNGICSNYLPILKKVSAGITLIYGGKEEEKKTTVLGMNYFTSNA